MSLDDVVHIFTDPYLLIAHIITLTLSSSSVYGWIGYRSHGKPMWPVILTIAATLMLMVDTGLVAMYLGITHSG